MDANAAASTSSAGDGINATDGDDKKKKPACQGCYSIKIPCVQREYEKRGRRPKDKSLAAASSSKERSTDSKEPETSPSDTLTNHTSASLPPDFLQWTLPEPNPTAPPLSLPSAPIGENGMSTFDFSGISPVPSAPYQAPVLSLLDTAEAKEASAKRHRASPRVRTLPVYPDPIEVGLLSSTDAEALFPLFHEQLNPFILLFDPDLHTATFVRQHSVILFSAILAASAKFFRPDLYPGLVAHAQQLVIRGMADSVSHIGMIQAIAVLVFWKEASDCSAWLRIGWAIRIAYQLKLYTPRHHPLPTDVTAAKEQMNLERTWFCLILFDHSYRLHDENNDPPGHTLKDRMGVADWVALNGEQATPGDLRLCASIELAHVIQLARTLEHTQWGASSDALVTHLSGLLDTIRRTHLDSNSRTYRSSVGTPIEHQLRFHYNWAAVALTKAGLISRGMRDETFLSELIPRVAALVQSLEDLASSANVLERLQDVVAVTLFNLAEFLASLFPCVSNSTQELIVRWMTKVYSTCNSIANGNEESVPAYIQRFYRAVLRHVAFSNLVPPTRTQSRAPSPGAPPIVNPEPPKPFDQLGPLEFELFPDMPSGFQTDDGMVDADYWETLFPGSTDDDWAWLDPTYLNLDDIAVDTTL